MTLLGARIGGLRRLALRLSARIGGSAASLFGCRPASAAPPPRSSAKCRPIILSSYHPIILFVGCAPLNACGLAGIKGSYGDFRIPTRGRYPTHDARSGSGWRISVRNGSVRSEIGRLLPLPAS
jgi:hypothetical protein